jgi:decaprenylphospho-beta-D-erythro-pentofuranosid-2-ulose 2-reductase
LIDATGMPQRAVVIGGYSDLAMDLCRRLASRRLESVLLAGRDALRLEAAARELREAGVATVETASLDVTASADAERFAREATERLGGVDLLIVASGVLGSSELDALDAEGVASQLTSNFTGPAALMTAFAGQMRSAGQGTILVYSSVAGLRVRKANFVYGAAKAGLDGFAQGLGDALVGTGVSVVVARPSFVPTSMTAGRSAPPLSATPEQVSRDIIDALERGRETLTTPRVLGAVFVLLRLLPRALWRKLPL